MPLLQAKIANLANLDQANRNDLKHVHIMLLVLREYMVEGIEAVEAGAIGSRPVIAQLELVRKVIASPEAIKCSVSHEINFTRIWPRELLAKANDPRFQNFLKHRLSLSV